MFRTSIPVKSHSLRRWTTPRKALRIMAGRHSPAAELMPSKYPVITFHLCENLTSDRWPNDSPLVSRNSSARFSASLREKVAIDENTFLPDRLLASHSQSFFVRWSD